MTMRFRTTKAALVTMLGAAAAGRFRVVGYQSKGMGAEEVKDLGRAIQVFYTSGDFKQSAGGLTGPVMHDLTFRIEATAGSASQGDLAALTNPASTAVEIAAALTAFQDAALLADDSYDELLEIVYQIIMDAENLDLGLAVGEVANRWIGSMGKSEPEPRGEYVIVSGSIEFGCRVSEDLVGDQGVAADPVLGPVLAEVEVNRVDSASADPAQAGIRGGS